ncbi:hypothetical protein [Novosphingobium sp. TCA1]|uniref:hypothetical protein n=1 Tax=Novosphingobium sp. TCA1 TaxID=2682474 RepID=UPI00130A5E62|nr:hypothetical protein [Novosphingobium sp. TCA1]GFE73495.1 hypothetical protein NTCA1_11440 [Novosphingobium sp. TCA1]
MTEKLRAHRQSLNDHEAMADAQAGCVPCKLCGGKAVITDAGVGAGYYIACENSGAFRAAQGCMITERRLGGWAYNVMDWWNRLHSSPTSAAEDLPALLADKARLDYLDRCNAALNATYGTTYSWKLIQSHNVNRLMLGDYYDVDLNDSQPNGLPSCRDAIDERMRNSGRAAA